MKQYQLTPAEKHIPSQNYIEDFSELDASNVSDDIINNTEDTLTLLDKYIDELDVTLDKDRLKHTMKTLYNEAQDLEL